MGKYDPLRVFLGNVEAEVSDLTLTFDKIQAILSDKLPASAYRHRQWWANPSSPYDHPYAQSWLAAGWKVDTVNQREEWVRFRRVS